MLGVLFVMTTDSVRDDSGCRNEWTWALKYGKPVIPVRLQRDAELPFRLGSRQYVDFSDDVEAGLARLRLVCRWPGGDVAWPATARCGRAPGWWPPRRAVVPGTGAACGVAGRQAAHVPGVDGLDGLGHRGVVVGAGGDQGLPAAFVPGLQEPGLTWPDPGFG